MALLTGCTTTMNLQWRRSVYQHHRYRHFTQRRNGSKVITAE